MSLYERYELLDLSRDIGVKTFEAREIATGRPVKVHLFVQPGAPLQAALLKAIDKLPDEERHRVIEKGKHEGTPYIVTDRLMDHEGLSEWVQAVSHAAKPAKPLLETAGAWKFPPAPQAPVTAPNAPAPAQPAQASPPQTPNPPAAAPDLHSQLNQKFTELFATAERPIVADSLLQTPERSRDVAAPVRPPDPQPRPAAAVPPASPEPAVAPPQAKSEPGEFTRMFQAPAVAPPSTAAAPQIPTPPSAAPAEKNEPGEFTRMFQAPKGPVGVPPLPATPAPTVTASRAAAPSAPPAPLASPAAKSGPGEFTRFFETPSPAGPMPHSPAVQQPLTPQAPGRSGYNQVSEFTRTFGKGADAPAPPAAAPPPAAPPQPGEFTRMFQAPGAAVPAAGAPISPVVQSLTNPQPAQPSFPSAMGGTTPTISTPGPAAPPKPSAPGDYTRQFSAPAQLTFGQTSGTPAAPAAPSSHQAFAPPAMGQPAMPNMAPSPVARKSKLPLILGMAGIVLVVVLLVVFFAMRPK